MQREFLDFSQIPSSAVAFADGPEEQFYETLIVPPLNTYY
jgi:hypothetical protein